MPPYFVLADFYAEEALPRVAYSALPRAPVQPDRQRRRRLTQLSAVLRRWLAISAPPATTVECTPAR